MALVLGVWFVILLLLFCVLLAVSRLGGCICDLFWVVCVLLDACMGFVVAVVCVLRLCLVLMCIACCLRCFYV